MKLENSLTLFRLSCATPDIIFNLLMTWSVFGRSRRSRYI